VDAAVVTPAVTLQPAFAVPLGAARLSSCERLNRELEALFLAREDDAHRNPMPSHIPQAETFESRFNLFRWPESCVQELRKFVLDTVLATVREATTLLPADLFRLTLHNHTWFHITRHAGSFISHNHPMASWSAVYCVRAGEPVAGEPGSGVLRLLDPRAGAAAYADSSNARLQPAFALAPIDFHLTEGEIIVFPSYLFHEVTPFYGRDTRITVATNCWFA
jgi:uncharacterized protein (TIGR02466 family)